MLKKIIDILSNPILFYADKAGNSVFRNFCWFRNTGCMYKFTLSKAQVGKILEYRFELEKYLKPAYFIIPVIIYFIFIHLKFNMWNMLLCEFLWIILVFFCQATCSYLYSRFLVKNFGKYEVVEFAPNLPQHKFEEFRANFKSKIIIIIAAIVIFFIPAFIIQYSIKLNVTAKRNFSAAIKLSKVYFALYPKNESIYDMRAYALYMKHDYEAALKDYKDVLDMSGKSFSSKDLVRLANLLFLEKKISTPENAVDILNEYATRKKMSVLEQSQLLWIKSLFRIENNSTEAIIQDYNDLLISLDQKDVKNQFYISSDKAYVLYLMGDYESAINSYNLLISYAEANKKEYSKELRSLYAERGFAKRQCGDNIGANADFVASGIDTFELEKYEPSFSEQEFVVDKF